jgi:hypothetical protein
MTDVVLMIDGRIEVQYIDYLNCPLKWWLEGRVVLCETGTAG